MDYGRTQHYVRQAPELRLRQMEAFQNFAPQTNAGSVIEAYADAAEADAEKRTELEGGS